ncbi:MAG: ABC transporter transmembrane domain-containing protein [Myxococcota bacterium]|nr:ABC transporter transmembrane domain-containing protein [Myxococcota bacterium]
MKTTLIPDREKLGKLAQLLKPHFWVYLCALLTLLLAAGAALIYPQLMRIAVDEAFVENSQEHLNHIALLAVLVFILHSAFIWIRHFTMSWLGERVVADLRQKVFNKILRFSLSWFHEHRTGEIVGRLASDTTMVQSVIGSQLSMALRSIVQILACFVILLSQNAKLTLFVLVVVPPLTLATFFFGRQIRIMGRKIQERLAETSARVEESIAGIETVQAFTQEEREYNLYHETVEKTFDDAVTLARWRASFMSVISLSGYLTIALILWYGGQLVLEGALSKGDLVAFILYSMMIASALFTVANVWGAIQRALGAIDRILEILNTNSEISTPAHPQALNPKNPAITFKHTSFHYPNRPEKPVLQNISLHIEHGETVAFVGHSGAGKTTLVKLLMRFYDPSNGAIELGGLDIRQLDLEKLRQSFALVSQEPILFSGSILNNIRYAKPSATSEQVKSAAERAAADHFIQKLPHGYATEVGERGMQLSGGQKQRVAIARALLANPQFLVLDEATSNLDSENETLVQEHLSELMMGRTTLVIAHRLSTIKAADRIVVLEEGQIVEEGDHLTLMQAKSTYAKLVEMQIIQDATKAPLH